MRTIALLAALAVAGCSATTPPPAPASPPKFANNDIVEFELKSWGRTVKQWRIVPTGQGSFAERIAATGAPYEPYRMDWHDFDAGAAGYARIASAIDALPDPAPSYHDCTNRITDAGYGTLRITRGAETREIAIYDGCFDDDYRAFLGKVKGISETVEGWGKAQPVTRSEKVDTR